MVAEGGACADVGEAFILSCSDFIYPVRGYELVCGDLYVGGREANLPSYLLS